jgi:bacteriocin-like protein
MTNSMIQTFATSDILAQCELSTDELETVIGGATLMSGVPNSMTIAFQRGPNPPPRIWSGGAPHGVIHMAAF